MLDPSRWRQDRWRDHVWTARIENFRAPDEPIVIELEQISSGMIDVQIMCGNGQYIPVDPPMYLNHEKAEDAAMRAIKDYFQSSRYPYFVLQFVPWTTAKELGGHLDVHALTAVKWFKNPDTRMTRQAVNEVLGVIGIRSKRGDRFRGEADTFILGPAVWEPVDNGQDW